MGTLRTFAQTYKEQLYLTFYIALLVFIVVWTSSINNPAGYHSCERIFSEGDAVILSCQKGE